METLMTESSPPFSLDRYPLLLARLAFFAGIGVLAYVILDQVSGVLFTLFTSLLIAYVLAPIVDWMERRKVPRTGALLLLMVLALVAVCGFALWVLPPIFQELHQLAGRLHAWIDSDHSAILSRVEAWSGFSAETDLAPVLERVKEAAPQMLAHMGTFLERAAEQTSTVISSALQVVMLPFFIFYFLRDFDRITQGATALIPLDRRESILARVARCHAVIGGWLAGQATVAAILALYYALGLWFVDIRIGIAIGMIAGMLSVVPYLGFAFGLGLALTMALLGWDGPTPVIGVAIVFGIGHLLEASFLTPKIVGEKVGLPPVVVLIALLAGGEAFGLIGILLAVPTAGVLKVLAAEMIDSWRSSSQFLGSSGAETP